MRLEGRRNTDLCNTVLKQVENWGWTVVFILDILVYYLTDHLHPSDCTRPCRCNRHSLGLSVSLLFVQHKKVEIVPKHTITVQWLCFPTELVWLFLARTSLSAIIDVEGTSWQSTYYRDNSPAAECDHKLVSRLCIFISFQGIDCYQLMTKAAQFHLFPVPVNNSNTIKLVLSSTNNFLIRLGNICIEQFIWLVTFKDGGNKL